MKINTIEELDEILNYCKAKTYSEIRSGGNFYKVKAQDFLFPNGQVETREFIEKRKASLIVPITNDYNFVFAIQPIALVKEGALIEFPAGYVEGDEKTINAGIRELAEETGYVPEKIIYLGNHYQDPGSIKEPVDVYLAFSCEKKQEQKLDKGEYIKQVEIPFELVQELIDMNYFKDANTFIAMAKATRYLQKLYNKEAENKKR